jgi:hypothetical protein
MGIGDKPVPVNQDCSASRTIAGRRPKAKRRALPGAP